MEKPFSVYFMLPSKDRFHARLAVFCPVCDKERTEILDHQDGRTAQCPVCFHVGEFKYPKPEWHHPDYEDAVMETRYYLDQFYAEAKKVPKETVSIEVPKTGTFERMVVEL